MDKKPERLLSLDVFRGMTVAGMIVVNSPGNSSYVYPQLAHSAWNGCTFADFIFPFFMFIVGVAITFSLSKRKDRGDNQTKLILQIFRRSAIIFLLGFILGIFPNFDFVNIVFTGILKKIAVVYFFTSLIFLKTNYRTQIIFCGVCLFVYWILLTFIPVPGAGFPGLSKDSNLVIWLDEFFARNRFSQIIWDSFGGLTTITSVSTSLLGVITGHLLISNKDNITKTIYMFAAGNILILAGYFWDFWFPINKILWTSSFVLFTGGFALNLLALCFWSIDIKGYKTWTKPFLVFGVNAIAVYFLAVLVGRYLKFINVTDFNGGVVNLKTFLYNNLFLPIFDPVNASLVYSITYTLLWLAFVWVLYSKKIFIKV